jgi:DNA-binding transcriptional ArsR family regulator
MQEYSQPRDLRAERELAHPTRRAILELLAGEQGLAPRSIAGRLELPVAGVAYHVEVLTACGAVETAVGKRRGERLARLAGPPVRKGRKDPLDASGSMRADVSEAQLKSLIEMASHLRPGHAPGA